MEAWDEEVRDDWTKKDLKIWFGVNRFIHKFQILKFASSELYVVTTKQYAWRNCRAGMQALLDSDDDEDDSEKEKEINTLKIFS
ncbi:unnamed protein product [Brassica oleracea]